IHPIRSSQLAHEPKQEWNRAILDARGRAAFARKAKADRFAWNAADQLASGKLDAAGESAKEGIALVGEEDFVPLCRRYATTSFRVPLNTADEFLASIKPDKRT